MSQTSSPKQAVFLAGLSTASKPELGNFTPTGFRFNYDVTPSQAAFCASSAALVATGLAAGQIDFVISCTQTPDFNNPGLVSGLLHKLGQVGLPGLEIKQSSAGSLYAIDFGVKLIESNQATKVLVCCTEFLSRYFPADFDSFLNLPAGAKACHALFADGAAAFMLLSELPRGGELKNSYRVISSRALSLGAKQASLYCALPSSCQFPQRIKVEDVQSGRHFPRFDSELFDAELQEIFSAPELAELAAELKGARSVISHQIKAGQNDSIANACQLRAEKFYDIFDRHRHLASAGLPQALACWQQTNTLMVGEQLALLAVGAGRNFGHALLRCADE